MMQGSVASTCPEDHSAGAPPDFSFGARGPCRAKLFGVGPLNPVTALDRLALFAGRRGTKSEKPAAHVPIHNSLFALFLPVAEAGLSICLSVVSAVFVLALFPLLVGAREPVHPALPPPLLSICAPISNSQISEWPCCPSQNTSSMARVYADVNQHMPKSYWDYDSVNISWGVLENYEVVRKIGTGLLVAGRLA